MVIHLSANRARRRVASFVSGMVWSSAHQALKSVEAAMVDHVLGTGLTHLISTQHLQLRNAAFNHLHHHHAPASSPIQSASDVDASTPPYVSHS